VTSSSKRAGSGFTCGVPGRFWRAPLDPFWRFVGEVEVMSSPNSQIQIRLGRNGGPVPRHAIPKVADAPGPRIAVMLRPDWRY
jgi:hypothetical protein